MFETYASPNLSPAIKQKAPHFTKAVPTSRRAPNLAGGGEGGERGQGARCLTGDRDCGCLPGKGPVGCCLPPTPWEGPRGRSHFPGLWPPGQSCLRPLQRGRVHCTGSTLLLRVQQRPWGYLAQDGAPLPPGCAKRSCWKLKTENKTLRNCIPGVDPNLKLCWLL